MTTIDNQLTVQATRLAGVDLVEAWSKGTPDDRVRFAFPIAAPVTSSISLAYAEIEPGGAIPWHVDSAAEEILLVRAGRVEVGLEAYQADETVVVEAGCAVCFPAGRAHRVHNSGVATARTVHAFGAAGVAVTFADPLMPFDLRTVGEAR
jgi:mannose-6-phosphate isomerase-like protein (cupin superfamily)